MGVIRDVVRISGTNRDVPGFQISDDALGKKTFAYVCAFEEKSANSSSPRDIAVFS
jgi:hypothetical protein